MATNPLNMTTQSPVTVGGGTTEPSWQDVGSAALNPGWLDAAQQALNPDWQSAARPWNDPGYDASNSPWVQYGADGKSIVQYGMQQFAGAVANPNAGQAGSGGAGASGGGYPGGTGSRSVFGGAAQQGAGAAGVGSNLQGLLAAFGQVPNQGTPNMSQGGLSLPGMLNMPGVNPQQQQSPSFGSYLPSGGITSQGSQGGQGQQASYQAPQLPQGGEGQQGTLFNNATGYANTLTGNAQFGGKQQNQQQGQWASPLPPTQPGQVPQQQAGVPSMMPGFAGSPQDVGRAALNGAPSVPGAPQVPGIPGNIVNPMSATAVGQQAIGAAGQEPAQQGQVPQQQAQQPIKFDALDIYKDPYTKEESSTDPRIRQAIEEAKWQDPYAKKMSFKDRVMNTLQSLVTPTDPEGISNQRQVLAGINAATNTIQDMVAGAGQILKPYSELPGASPVNPATGQLLKPGEKPTFETDQAAATRLLAAKAERDQQFQQDYPDQANKASVRLAGLIPYLAYGTPKAGTYAGGRVMSYLVNKLAPTAAGAFVMGASQLAADEGQRIMNGVTTAAFSTGARLLGLAASKAAAPTVGGIAGGLEGYRRSDGDFSWKTLAQIAGGTVAGAATGYVAKRGVQGLISKATGGNFKVLRPSDAQLAQGAKDATRADARPLGQQKAILEAAKKENVPMAPSDISGSPTARAELSRLEPGKEGVLTASVTKQAQDAALQKSFNEVVESVLPKGKTSAQLDTQVNRVYAKLGQKKVDYGNLTDNPTINYSMQKVLNNKQFQAPPKDSAQLLMNTADDIQNDINTLISNKVKKTSDKVKQLVAAKKQILEHLDKQIPEYKIVRKFAQKNAVYEKAQAKMANINRKSDEPLPEQYKATFFNTTKKQERFLNDVQAAGGDTEKARRFITIVNSLEGSTYAKLAKKNPKIFGQHAAESGSGTGMITGPARRIFRQDIDNTLVKMSSDPKYADEILKLANMKGKVSDDVYQNAAGNLIAKMAAAQKAKSNIPTVAPATTTDTTKKDKGEFNDPWASKNAAPAPNVSPSVIPARATVGELLPVRQSEPGIKSSLTPEKGSGYIEVGGKKQYIPGTKVSNLSPGAAISLSDSPNKPAISQQQISTLKANARDAKAAKAMDELALMPASEMIKMSSTLAGRQKIIKEIKKVGGDVETVLKLFKQLDGELEMSDSYDSSTPEGLIGKKVTQALLAKKKQVATKVAERDFSTFGERVNREQTKQGLLQLQERRQRRQKERQGRVFIPTPKKQSNVVMGLVEQIIQRYLASLMRF